MRQDHQPAQACGTVANPLGGCLGLVQSDQSAFSSFNFALGFVGSHTLPGQARSLALGPMANSVIVTAEPPPSPNCSASAGANNACSSL